MNTLGADLEKEIDLNIGISKINHKYIVKFFEHVRTKDAVYLMLELCDTTLMDYFEENPFNEEKLCKFGLQILDGLSALHKNNFIHRDLKANNILIKNGVCKIADFGMGTNQPVFSSMHVGAKLIRAPEFDLKVEGEHTSAVDVWAFGVMMHWLVFKDVPFFDKDEKIFRQKVWHDRYEIPEYPKMTSSFKEMLTACF